MAPFQPHNKAQRLVPTPYVLAPAKQRRRPHQKGCPRPIRAKHIPYKARSAIGTYMYTCSDFHVTYLSPLSSIPCMSLCLQDVTATPWSLCCLLTDDTALDAVFAYMSTFAHILIHAGHLGRPLLVCINASGLQPIATELRFLPCSLWHAQAHHAHRLPSTLPVPVAQRCCSCRFVTSLPNVMHKPC